MKQALKGGKGDKLHPRDVDPNQLAMGIKVELEHTKDRKVAREIAMDHLAEDPRYYSKLKKVHHESIRGRMLSLLDEGSMRQTKMTVASVYKAEKKRKGSLAPHDKDRARTVMQNIVKKEKTAEEMAKEKAQKALNKKTKLVKAFKQKLNDGKARARMRKYSSPQAIHQSSVRGARERRDARRAEVSAAAAKKAV